MAKLSYSNYRDSEVNLYMSLKEMEALDAFITEHGHNLESYSPVRDTHKGLRQALVRVHRDNAQSAEWGVNRYDQVIEYKVKKKGEVDAEA